VRTAKAIPVHISKRTTPKAFALGKISPVQSPDETVL